MADVKISALPPAANAATPDFYPAVKGGVTVRITHAQLMTLIETALTKLNLSGGGINLNANGSADFGVGALQIAFDGSIGPPSANWSILPDGSCQFAGGNFIIDPTGLLTSTKDIEVTDNTQGVIIKSPAGNRFRIVVSDLGALSTTPA